MITNKTAWEAAKRYLPGGVDSPVRAFRAVGGSPLFMERGKGAYLTDIEGRKYIDLCMSWGALILGHADPSVSRALSAQISKGTSYGTATVLETALAAEIQKAYPSMERLRFVSSGTEAVMSALRLARGFVRQRQVVKFEGCYHGHADSMLVKAGSGLATFGMPDSAGVPTELAVLTTVLPYNDADALTQFFEKADDVAAVIVEPVAANMGVVKPDPKFLSALVKVTQKSSALLIFDEVITGFRLARGGAAQRYGITPDLTCLGKIIGGGLPVGAFGGRAEIMKHLSPEGPVYQAGTLSGNPLSMVAGRAALSRLNTAAYSKLNRMTSDLASKIEKTLRKKGFEASVPCEGSLFTIFFREQAPRNWTEVSESDKSKYSRLFHHFLNQGIYAPPSAYEACFLSLSHGAREIKIILKAVESFR